MKLQIFALYDKKALGYMSPFFFQHKGQALRALEDITNEKSSPVNKHPEDFDLYTLGEYDDQTGQLTAITPPQYVETALNFHQNNKTTPIGVNHADKNLVQI